jgi:cytidine kinase
LGVVNALPEGNVQVVDLVTIGYLTLDDLVLNDDRVLRNTPGGGALFSAVGARTWSRTVGIHACSGGDYPAEFLEFIREGGIDVQGISAGPPRSLRLWLLEEDGLRKQQLPKLASAEAQDMDAARRGLPSVYRGAAGYHVAPALPATQRKTISQIREFAPGAWVTLDIWAEPFFDARPYLEPGFLAGFDAFLPSDKEVEALWGLDDLPGVMRHLASSGPVIVAVKRGERGSLVFDREHDRFWEVPIVPVNTVDSIGAGDAYCGGFLAGLIETGDALEAVLRGTVSASFAVQGYGALSGMGATREEVNRRLSMLRPLVKQMHP